MKIGQNSVIRCQIPLVIFEHAGMNEPFGFLKEELIKSVYNIFSSKIPIATFKIMMGHIKKIEMNLVNLHDEKQ